MIAVDTDYTPRAWVGCLGCYNEGRLTGAWLELDEGLDLSPVLAAICTRPNHEELWCFDVENLGSSEEMSVPEALERAEAMRGLLEAAESRGLPVPVALQYVENSNCKPGSWPDVADAFQCSVEDEADYVLEYLENSGIELPSWLHVDYRGSFEDLTSGMTSIRYEGELYLFWD